MIVSLSLAALLGIVVLLLPHLGPTEEILASTALFAAFSLVALCCAIVIEQRRLRVLMWIGIAATGLALIAWLVLLWFDHWLDSSGEELMARTGGFFTTFCIWCGYFGLMTAMPLGHPWAKVVKWGTIAAASIFAFVILLSCVAPDFVDWIFYDEFAVRMMGVDGILVACGTVLAPILWKVQALRQAASVESIPTRIRVKVVCPRCAKMQTLKTGPSECATCGLKFAIKVEEPRCVCGYLLYQLESETCPECGRPIAERDRWASRPAPISIAPPGGAEE